MFIGKKKAREEVLKRFPHLGFKEKSFFIKPNKENEYWEKRFIKAQDKSKKNKIRIERKEKIREFVDKGLSLRAVAELFEVSRSRIHQIYKGYNSNDEHLKKLKLIIKKRDNFQCQWGEKCKDKKGKRLIIDEKDLIVHHIDFDDENNNPSNLITLCKRCHSSFHSRFHIDSLKEKNLHLRQKVERVIKICKGCGKEMKLTLSQSKARIFCSFICKKTFYNTPEMKERSKRLFKKSQKRYYQKNKKEINKKNKKYRQNQKNKDKINEKNRQRYHENPEKYKNYFKKYYYKNIDKIREYYKKYSHKRYIRHKLDKLAQKVV